MKRLKENDAELAELTVNASALQESYINELEVNPQYSLEVDPENKYNMPKVQKEFIKYYVDFKNVNTAAELCGIDQDTAKQFFIAYSTQSEIRRINLALYQRQFCNRLLSIDELGGYLTSLLTEEYVNTADQLKTIDKLKVVQMLIDLNKLKATGLQDPNTLMSKDIDTQLKELSVTTIKQLLSSKNNTTEKQEIISEIGNDNLTPEENAYLSTLPTKDLLKLIDDYSERNEKDENK